MKIQEARIRVPTSIGQNIGIVAALILVQAGIEAYDDSPIDVIDESLSGLAYYAISDLNLNYMKNVTVCLSLSASVFGIFTMVLYFIPCLTYLIEMKT